MHPYSAAILLAPRGSGAVRAVFGGRSHADRITLRSSRTNAVTVVPRLRRWFREEERARRSVARPGGHHLGQLECASLGAVVRPRAAPPASTIPCSQAKEAASSLQWTSSFSSRFWI
jgi:hypothetical protein